jgi:hypothetical protein
MCVYMCDTNLVYRGVGAGPHRLRCPPDTRRGRPRQTNPPACQGGLRPGSNASATPGTAWMLRNGIWVDSKTQTHRMENQRMATNLNTIIMLSLYYYGLCTWSIIILRQNMFKDQKIKHNHGLCLHYHTLSDTFILIGTECEGGIQFLYVFSYCIYSLLQ